VTVVLSDIRGNANGAGTPDPRRQSRRQCLSSYRQFRTNDRAVAEAEAAKFLSPHSLRLASTGPHLDALLSYASLGPVALYLLDYDASVSIDRPSQPDYMAVFTPLTGQVLVRHQNQEFVARPSGAHGAVSWGDSVHMELTEDCAMLSVRAEMAALTEALRHLIPNAEGPLRFESAVVNPRSCQAMLGTIQLITSVLDGFGSIHAVPSHLRRQLREHALNTILLTVPHNHTAEIFSPRRPLSGRVVRQAVDLIESESMGELTVSDVAKHAGVGIRTLEIAFQRELQCTPRTFIQRIRMERAHQELQDADPCEGFTVTRIALRWGFGHTGRFATAYRGRYGVPPSQTLRQTARVGVVS
jgi:AraC-like DNA-binding protein